MNTMMTAFMVVVSLVTSFVLAWPEPAVAEVLVPTVLVSVVVPFTLAPISRTFWTAMVVLALPPEISGSEPHSPRAAP
mgnify:FL=1